MRRLLVQSMENIHAAIFLTEEKHLEALQPARACDRLHVRLQCDSIQGLRMDHLKGVPNTVMPP